MKAESYRFPLDRGCSPVFDSQRKRKCLIVLALWACCSIVIAGRASAQPPDADAEGQNGLPAHALEEVVITAVPLPRTAAQLAQPVFTLDEGNLLSLHAPQLGEALGHQPGVHPTYFGPGSSRPLVRGLGADNVRVLQNGLDLLDVAATSPDHAVAFEPLLVRRIEVVRGPSALLYGPNAIGGVVNVITHRIPQERLARPVKIDVKGRGMSVNDEAAGAALLEGGYKGLAYTFDIFGRATNNTRIPGFARSRQLRAAEPLPPDAPRFREPKGEIINSALSSEGGAFGLSYVWEGGHFFGASPSFYSTTYGIPGAPSTFIDLEQKRLDFSGAWDAGLPSLGQLSGKLGLVDYEHVEFEQTTAGAVPGTKFTNRGYNLRLEGTHRPFATLEGAFGLESFYARLDASGAEAFMPPNKTFRQSLFAFEELLLRSVRLQAAGRLDVSQVEAEASPNFGAAARRQFVTGGTSLGAVWAPKSPWTAALNIAFTQRHPNAQELYANGPHLATQQFEVGDRNLDVQQAIGVELSLRTSTGRWGGSATGFYNHFDDFIALLPTGRKIDISDRGHFHGTSPLLPEFQFRNVSARFIGFEIESTVNLLQRKPYRVDASVRSDFVHARNRTTGEPLPFMPPLRFGGSLTTSWSRMVADVSLLWAGKQTDTPRFVTPTESYLLLDATARYRLPTAWADTEVFVRGMNLLNQKARLATSPLKDVAPLPGIGAAAGFQIRF